MLFEDSDRAGGNDKRTGMDIHLRIAIVKTIVASTCSLLFVVSDVRSRRRSGRTRMNNTRTDNLSALSSQGSELQRITHRMRVSRAKCTRPALDVSEGSRFPSERSVYLV